MKWELLVPLLAILIIGMPHGASDILIARRLYSQGWFKLFSFVIGYFVIAIIVLITWHFYPIFSLSVFLLISALHFGLLDTLANQTTDYKVLRAFIYGATPILIPITFHTSEVNEIFRLLIFDESDLAYQLDFLFPFWLIGVIVLFAKNSRKTERELLEIIVLAILLALLPPLWGFAFYFCFVHSVRHFLNLSKILNEIGKFDIFAMLVTVAATFMLILAATFLLSGEKIEDDLLRVTFIGLAALTVPHMLLVDFYPKIKGINFLIRLRRYFPTR